MPHIFSYVLNLYFMYATYQLTHMKCFNFIYDIYAKYVNYMWLIYILPYMPPLTYMAEYMPFFYMSHICVFRMGWYGTEKILVSRQ